MKWIAALWVGVSIVAPYELAGQGGTVHLSNLVRLDGLDAPIYHLDGRTPLAGAAYLAQLYAGRGEHPLEAVGQAVPFHEGAAAGYLYATAFDASANVVYLPSVEPGELAYLELRAWVAAEGSTFEEAVVGGGHVGVSGVFALLTGGAGFPPSVPANLVGLSSFSLQGPPMILRHPAGSVLFASQGFELVAEVMASPGAALQWQRNGADLPGAEGPRFIHGDAGPADSGEYRLLVSDEHGTTISEVAQVTVLSVTEGGTVVFLNRFPAFGVDAPVLDAEGVRLAGPDYVAQLFGGEDSASLSAIGAPVVFGEGPNAGYWGVLTQEAILVIPGVGAGERASVQVKI